MKNNYTAEASIKIHAHASKVWKALTTPHLIRQYLFGTEASSAWTEGSPIVYRGEWEGKQYEDKGVIKEMQPHELLVTTYWSSLSGMDDIPENYKTVTYTLSEEGNNTILTITQDNNESEESRDHSQQNWVSVLQKLKDVVETSA